MCKQIILKLKSSQFALFLIVLQYLKQYTKFVSDPIIEGSILLRNPFYEKLKLSISSFSFRSIALTQEPFFSITS